MFLFILLLCFHLAFIYSQLAIVDPFFSVFQNQNSSFYPDLGAAIDSLGRKKKKNNIRDCSHKFKNQNYINYLASL